VRIAERRLQELEDLAVEGKLTEEIFQQSAEQFRVRSRKTRDRILQLAARGKFEEAAALTFHTESFLAAHEMILSTLSTVGALEGVPVMQHVVSEAIEDLESITEAPRSGPADLTTHIVEEAQVSAAAKLQRAHSEVRRLQRSGGGTASDIEERLERAAAVLQDARTGHDRERERLTRWALQEATEVERLLELKARNPAVPVELPRRTSIRPQRRTTSSARGSRPAAGETSTTTQVFDDLGNALESMVPIDTLPGLGAEASAQSASSIPLIQGIEVRRW
jgi:hypothetical protein